MPIDLFTIGKEALIRKLPTSINTALSRLDDFGILPTGVSGRLPIKDPQRTYMWEVVFRDIMAQGQFITHYAKTTSVPASMTENIKRWYNGVEYSYPGRDISPRIFRVTFWDNQDLDVYRYFQTWYSAMNEGQGRRKVNPYNFHRDIFLQMKDSSGIQYGQTFRMTNAYPTEISDVMLSYNESSEFTFDVMFSFREKIMGS